MQCLEYLERSEKMKRYINVVFSVLLVTVLSACNSPIEASSRLQAIATENLSIRPSESNVPQTQKLNVVDVESLQVVGGLPGVKGSPLFLKTDTHGKAMISKAVEWINSSKIADGTTEFGKHGYPMVVRLKMNDGKIVIVEPAYNCILKTNEDGSGSKTCTPVKDEIVLSKDSKQIRLTSPEIYDWLQKGWKQEK
jgi:hypothetical protein